MLQCVRTLRARAVESGLRSSTARSKATAPNSPIARLAATSIRSMSSAVAMIASTIASLVFDDDCCSAVYTRSV
mgnify:CR=1 FL=1